MQQMLIGIILVLGLGGFLPIPTESSIICKQSCT